MPALTIPDLDESILARLEDRAKAHGRTVEAEAKAILAEASPLEDPFWEMAKKHREQLAAGGRTFSDSAELIREDRDR